MWCSGQLLFSLLFLCVESRRRTSAADKAFKEPAWRPHVIEESSTTSTTPPSSTTETSTSTTTTTTEETGDVITSLLSGTMDLINMTKALEIDHQKSLDEALNRTVLWVDASYKAMDIGLNVSLLTECRLWRKRWNTTSESTFNSTVSEDESSSEEDEEEELKDTEFIESKTRLEELQLNVELLTVYEAVVLVFSELCGEHDRYFWIRDREMAREVGIEEDLICQPFKEGLFPEEETLFELGRNLNQFVHNKTLAGWNSTDEAETDNGPELRGNPQEMYEPDEQLQRSNNVVVHVVGDEETTTDLPLTPSPENNLNRNQHEVSVNQGISSEETDFYNEDAVDAEPFTSTVTTTSTTAATTTTLPKDGIAVYDDDIYDYVDMAKRFRSKAKKINGKEKKTKDRRFRSGSQSFRKKRSNEDDDWLDSLVMTENELEEQNEDETKEKKEEEGDEENETAELESWIEVNTTDYLNPTLLITSVEGIRALGLKIDENVFKRYEKVGLSLQGVCADYTPKTVEAFDNTGLEDVNIEGPIGVNISALEAAGVNLTALAEKLRNDTEVDDILSRTEKATKTYGGSYILPVLEKNQYDPFSAPIVFQGSAVVVRFGIYIESMSNFQTTTMDYDMDIYLMMAWRDARLVNPYGRPILVKEEEILEKIWRPDPFFANAKEAEFHEVTFLNFLMRIFDDGLVLYETRVKITPSCNLILCKYPHDKQTCDLLIKSFAYPIETVRFEWFTQREHAIDKNPDVKLPELYIDRYEPTICNKGRKSGAFSCLRAVFRLKRDVGFHIAQTYIPTSLALMFSWVGVWLPEEFMEGRIGVAITVLLTLSTESAGAREHLPSVSYLKAIDLWFGFITGFVFFTLLQTLFVIGFDKRANQLRKWALKKKSDMSEELREAMLQKAKRYHKTGRYLDNFCRVFYPLSFVLFLIMYYFVFTEGRQDDCISRR